MFPLAREDSVLAFCGDTAFAFLILLQLNNSVTNYRKSRSREQDITSLRPHLPKVMERIRDEVHNLPKENSGIDTKDFRLLFAGYSCRSEQFKAVRFSPTTRSFNGFIFVHSHFTRSEPSRYKTLSLHRRSGTESL